MLYAYKAGVTPESFYDNTIAENMRMITAQRLNEYSADVRARMIAYYTSMIHVEVEKRPTMYDFFPLAFDPSKEEIERIKIEEKNKEFQLARQLLNEYDQERRLFDEQMNQKNG